MKHERKFVTVGVERLKSADLLGSPDAIIFSHAVMAKKDLALVNFSLIDALIDNDCLFTVTARDRGNLVGYSAVTLAPDLLSQEIFATMLLLYARPEYPLIGLRLAREALEESRRRGANRFILLQDRTTPDSFRMATLFAKRFGLAPCSLLFSLEFPS